MIPDETIREIRERADIVRVIGRHVELKKSGRNHKGLCPFHNEKTPSFNVNGEKGFFYCFGCQKKGDVFSFAMEYEGKSFLEAAEGLASEFGITIPDTGESPEKRRQSRSERGAMLEANAAAADFFRERLQSPAGQRARDYLEGRDLGADVASAFRLGYAPDDWRSLGPYLASRGISDAIAERAGLLIKQPRASGYYDRFRDRLMCPVFSAGGDVVGFSGRRLKDDEDAGAKYINSPESPVFKKSHLLYGLVQARDGFREAGAALLVEGNFDVVQLHQAGFRQAVAPLGTALTEEQARSLRRLVGSVVLLYDGDRAGRAATLKGLKILLAEDVSVSIALVPEGEDPDSLLRSGGPEALRAVLDSSEPALEYFIHEAWSRGDASADARAEAIREAAQVLRTVSDATKRDLAVGTLASALLTDEETLRRGLRRALQGQRKPAQRDPEVDSQPARPGPPANPLELDIVTILFEYPELLATAEELNIFSSLTDSRLRDMYSAAREGRSLVSATQDPTIAKHVLSGDRGEIANPEDHLRSLASRLGHRQTRNQLEELQRQAEAAARRGDAALQRQLVRQIIELRKQVD